MDKVVVDLVEEGNDLFLQRGGAKGEVTAPVLGDRGGLQKEEKEEDRHEDQAEKEPEHPKDSPDALLKECSGCRCDGGELLLEPGEALVHQLDSVKLNGIRGQIFEWRGMGDGRRLHGRQLLDFLGGFLGKRADFLAVGRDAARKDTALVLERRGDGDGDQGDDPGEDHEDDDHRPGAGDAASAEKPDHRGQEIGQDRRDGDRCQDRLQIGTGGDHAPTCQDDHGNNGQACQGGESGPADRFLDGGRVVFHGHGCFGSNPIFPGCPTLIPRSSDRPG